MCTNPGIKKYLAIIYVGLWNYCPSDVGCHEETKCQGLKFAQTNNSHPKIQTFQLSRFGRETHGLRSRLTV
jgi:hypothetical protein